MPRRTCDLAPRSSAGRFPGTGWPENNDCRKQPEEHSASCRCFFRFSKRLQSRTSQRYSFRSGLFRTRVGQYESWECQAGRRLPGKSFRAESVRPPGGWSFCCPGSQAGRACLENVQILAVPIAADRQPVWKSGRAGEGSLERLEVLAGRAGTGSHSQSAALRWGSKRPNTASFCLCAK
jgi:hypothetical protein